jgi:hypothetical protein
MSDSCCGSYPKSEPAKVAMTAGPQAAEAAAEQTVANSHKSECCNDKPKKSEKRGCGC